MNHTAVQYIATERLSDAGRGEPKTEAVNVHNIIRLSLLLSSFSCNASYTNGEPKY